MPDIYSLIIPNYNTVLSMTYAIQIWSVLQMSISVTVYLGYPGNPWPPHPHLCEIFILLNCLVLKFRNIWIHFFESVPFYVEPVNTISEGVSAPPALQGGVVAVFLFFYILFSQTHSYTWIIRPGIICAFWDGHSCFFLYRHVITYPNPYIYPPMVVITTGAHYPGS